MRIFKLGFIALLTVVVSGCASYPEVVQVPEGTNLVAFESVQNEDSKYIGEKARWSGVIAGLKNHSDKTQVDVLYYPSRSTGRPSVKEEPIGRFRVYVDKFLDPAVYEKGRSITVLGEVQEKVSEKIDEYEYLYPTLKNGQLHLWKKEKEHTEVEFYYGWPGHYPRYYWRGGVRHIYTIGGTKAKVKSKLVEKN